MLTNLVNTNHFVRHALRHFMFVYGHEQEMVNSEKESIDGACAEAGIQAIEDELEFAE